MIRDVDREQRLLQCTLDAAKTSVERFMQGRLRDRSRELLDAFASRADGQIHSVHRSLFAAPYDAFELAGGKSIGDVAPAVGAWLLTYLGVDVLDDVMDGDPPKLYDAIPDADAYLLGSVLCWLPFRILAEMGSPGDQHLPESAPARDLVTALSTGLIRMSEGQQADLESARTLPNFAGAKAIADQKTGTLFALMMGSAADLAGAPESRSRDFYEFGRNVGIAFEIRMACHDLVSEPSLDLERGVVSVPIASWLDQRDAASVSRSELMLEARSLAASGWSERFQAFRESLQECRILVSMLCMQALESLSLAGNRSMARNRLEALVLNLAGTPRILGETQ